MSEWWIYSLSDFLLFSPRTYYRLFELYNRDIWPAQIIALTLGACILVLLRARGARRGQAIALILAACWAWVAWAYLLERYDTINWAARYFALGFAVEALLLLWAVFSARLFPSPRLGRSQRIGVAMFLFALTVQPVIGPMLGRPWSQAEVFGIAPDPTAIGTLGVLLASGRRVHWDLLAIPLIWCAISAATLWTMGSADAVVPLGLGGLSFLLALRNRIRTTSA